MSIRDQILAASTKEEKLTIYTMATSLPEYRFASNNTKGKWEKALTAVKPKQ